MVERQLGITARELNVFQFAVLAVLLTLATVGMLWWHWREGNWDGLAAYAVVLPGWIMQYAAWFGLCWIFDRAE